MRMNFFESGPAVEPESHLRVEAGEHWRHQAQAVADQACQCQWVANIGELFFSNVTVDGSMGARLVIHY
jgi:hypothetical protein